MVSAGVRRWIVLMGSILVGMPVGSFYSWSIYVNPVRVARPDFDPAVTVHANSIVISALSLACALTGRILVTKQGGRGCLTLRMLSASGSALSAVGVGLCGVGILVDIEWLLYLGGFLNGFGMGFAYVCFIMAFKTAWSHSPGFAAGWVMAVSSAGSFVFVWICQAVLSYLSADVSVSPIEAPAFTFFALAGILFLMQFLGSFLLLPPARAPGLAPPAPTSSSGVEDPAKAATSLGDPLLTTGDTTSEALDEAGASMEVETDEPVMSACAVLTSIQFWLVMFVFFANLFPVLGVLSILASYLQSRFPGTSAQESANVLALVNVVGTVMRLFVGFAAQAVGTFLLFGIALVLQTGLFLLLYLIINSSGLTLWEFSSICIAAKICYGAGFTLVNMLVDEVFGKKNGTQVYGMIIFGLMGAALAAPNVVVIWYKGCSALFPCNTTSGFVGASNGTWSHSQRTQLNDTTTAASGNLPSDMDTIKDYFAVCFSVAGAGALGLLLLKIMSRKDTMEARK